MKIAVAVLIAVFMSVDARYFGAKRTDDDDLEGMIKKCWNNWDDLEQVAQEDYCKAQEADHEAKMKADFGKALEDEFDDGDQEDHATADQVCFFAHACYALAHHAAVESGYKEKEHCIDRRVYLHDVEKVFHSVSLCAMNEMYKDNYFVNTGLQEDIKETLAYIQEKDDIDKEYTFEEYCNWFYDCYLSDDDDDDDEDDDDEDDDRKRQLFSQKKSFLTGWDTSGDDFSNDGRKRQLSSQKNSFLSTKSQPTDKLREQLRNIIGGGFSEKLSENSDKKSNNVLKALLKAVKNKRKLTD